MRFFIFLLFFAPLRTWAQPLQWQVPGFADPAYIDLSGGTAILPSGRRVTPVGQWHRIARSPFGLALSPQNDQVLVWHHGAVLTLLEGMAAPIRIPDYDGSMAPLNTAAFIGVVFGADNRTAYLSGGDRGEVVVFDTKTRQKIDSISLNQVFNGRQYTESWTSDLAIDTDKNRLYVLDRAHFRLVTIDLTAKKVIGSVSVGRIPFGIALSPDKKMAFVANVGLYSYPLVPGVTPTNGDSMFLSFPVFATHTKAAEMGVTLPDGRFVPGLGSALADEAMSVWTVDLEQQLVTHKFKTGHQIGEKIEEVEIVGGASPNSVAVGRHLAFISNATNDLISIIDYKKNKIIGEIPLKLGGAIDKYRGLMPFGLSLSPDEKKLYVALLGLNAVAVIDVAQRRVIGLIPTGWGTTRVVVSPDNKMLYITSARGFGAGPNGGAGFVAPPQGTYVGDIQLGLLQCVPMPSDDTLKKWTQQVLDNTFQQARLSQPAVFARKRRKPSPVIRHIVYITKENRTYDEVLGDLPQGKGDSTLARFGEKATIAVKKDTLLRGVNVTPNHHKIARQWAFSDNFYCDSDASIHGHHWMMGQMPNEYVEANSSAARSFNAFSEAPGRRFPGTTGGIDPEDYNEAGGIWDNLSRHKVSYFNFGESNEFANAHEEKYDTLFGAANAVAFALPQSLMAHTSRDYAGYNTNIPDQFRVEQFEREFTRLFLNGKNPMPAFIGVQLPNDHTDRPRPEDGYFFPHSFVADNDLALGRLLTFLSKTPYWKNMLVIVTEDDPQGGVDHIDAHRSLLLMAGPYVKRGHVSHQHANFGSILKTIYHLLGLPYVNQYDATAVLLTDFFTDKPDFSPYIFEKTDDRVFDPYKALRPYGRQFDWRKIPPAAKMDDEADQRADHYRQQKGQR